jgi:hypothetical protein
MVSGRSPWLVPRRRWQRIVGERKDSPVAIVVL